MRNKPMKSYYALRWEILKRDNFTCQYCGQHAPNVKLEVDHIKPVSEGGTDDKENLITSCYSCNRGKNSFALISKVKHNPQKPNKTTVQETIFEELKKTPGITTREISDLTGSNINVVRVSLHRMKNKNIVLKEMDKWFLNNA